MRKFVTASVCSRVELNLIEELSCSVLSILALFAGISMVLQNFATEKSLVLRLHYWELGNRVKALNAKFMAALFITKMLSLILLGLAAAFEVELDPKSTQCYGDDLAADKAVQIFVTTLRNDPGNRPLNFRVTGQESRVPMIERVI
mmetsp:Transcript_2159/g.5453  ORF Transcript_2159/g.5453 Transcript_2159/m.5453 type:complete len:146 (-) Transcript_2159:789-1226(-)